MGFGTGATAASTSSIGAAGIGLQAAGMLSSAIGAGNAAKSQKLALQAQAQSDSLNARAAASSLEAQAGLDLVNAQATLNATNTATELNYIGATATAGLTKTQAEIEGIGAKTSILAMQTDAAVSAIKAKSSIAMLDAGAQIAERQAHLFELQAQSALLSGEREEQGSRLQVAQLKSRQTATMAARGLDLSEGAPLMVLTGTDLMGEHTAIGIQQHALMAALGIRTQEANAQNEAAVKRFQSAMTASGSTLDTALTTARADALLANANASVAAKLAFADAGLTLADGEKTAQLTLAAANFANAGAASNMKKTSAEMLRLNSAGATALQMGQANGINPTAASMSSLLTGAGQVASSWYMFNKTATTK